MRTVHVEINVDVSDETCAKVTTSSTFDDGSISIDSNPWLVVTNRPPITDEMLMDSILGFINYFRGRVTG